MMRRPDALEIVSEIMQAFVQAEYSALVLQYTEPDDHHYKKEQAKVEQFLAKGVVSGLQRPSHPNPSWFVTGEAMIAQNQIAPRTIFQIKQYEHPQTGHLFRVYASHTAKGNSKRLSYFVNFFVIAIRGEWKIISRYDLDLLPEQDGKRFSDGNLSWIWHSGRQWQALGMLQAVKKITPPTDPDSLAEYERE